MMRTLLCLFLCFFTLGCSSKNSSSDTSWLKDNGKVKVLSTTAMIDDLVGQIGGEIIDHTTLIHGDVDPHSYELVKGDDEKFRFAHLVIGNGLGLEHGASLRYQLKEHPQVVYLGEEIQKRVPSRVLEFDHEVDPHVWMDISLWCEGIDPLVAALSRCDPEHTDTFKRNGDLLRQKMLQAHHEMQCDLEQVPSEKRYLVTSHDAFHYFAKAYLGSAERCIAPEGLAPEGQLSTADIKRVVDCLDSLHISVIFPESNVSRDALQKIATCCNHPVRISSKALYGDAMGTDNYLSMLQHNARVLKKEWNHD